MTHPAWHWEIPVDLFIAGLTAGLLIIGATLGSRPNATRATRMLPLLAPVVLSLAMLALFLDLGQKLNLWRFYTTFRVTAPMSWGSWILLAVYAASISLGLARLGVLRANVRWLERINLVLGVALGAYTGVLLAVLRSRELWNTPILPLLFLASAIATGSALVMLLPCCKDERDTLRRWAVAGLSAQLALVALYLLDPGAGAIRGGEYTAPFWSLVVFGGLAVPLTLELIEPRKRLHPTAAAPVLILAGGFALRWILVAAGQAV